MNVNHIAFLTHELEAVTRCLPDFCTPLSIEFQEAEGTREQYVEVAGESAPMLLLMQPVAEGPYLRAMRKRGPGLHHIGGTVPSLRALLPRIEKHRLLIHPTSVITLAGKLLWLCRPGVPFLIEIQEGFEGGGEVADCRLSLPGNFPVPSFIHGFFSNLHIETSQDNRFHFSVADKIVSFEVGVG